MKYRYLLFAILSIGLLTYGCLSPETREEVKVASMKLADAKVAFANKIIELELALAQNRISKEEYDLGVSLARDELKIVEDAYKATVDKAAAESKAAVGSGLHKTGDILDLLGMILPMFFPYAGPIIALLNTGVKGAANAFGPRPQVT